ncbi:sugar transferase [Allorhodopirellula solitaria]|uniref:Putative sugar transferase EpsL n=1 Tax=Allorhodopirellula solitaria TaxID=2527987 RepID=A0A5C5XSM0_9BACT|nr:sugar transferase [Allorhodopirellula solitaria]TWT65045.1 putative sugar transferase EpsL [Allorhodopirellula solitaria]
MNQSLLSKFIKRSFDISVAAFALCVLSPCLLLIWALVSLRLERPALFCQERLGLMGVPFKIIKFKTMISAVDAGGNVLSDDQRLTPLGTWLRKTSLDELPELWNVLVGEMSLVGPRPFISQYGPLYSEYQSRRHEVRPGITGWAQINGRNAISWEEKFELDIWYVENQSLWLDLKILWGTLWQMIRRDNISSEGHVTMPVFKGNSSAQDDRA